MCLPAAVIEGRAIGAVCELPLPHQNIKTLTLALFLLHHWLHHWLHLRFVSLRGRTLGRKPMPLAVEPLAIIARFAFDGILSVIHSSKEV